MFLLTGSSGFLGKEILKTIDTNSIKTLSRKHANFNVDLSVDVPLFKTQFSTVIHCAGKAHSVPKTHQEKQQFFDVNVAGTKNLLLGLEKAGLPQKFIFISSVAVYGLANGLSIKETQGLSAKDSYGNSKIQAENIVLDWCVKHDVICTILRLPLLVGPNPPGNLKSMIKGIGAGYYFNIDNGKARKSIVLVEDVAKIIPIVASIGGVYNLTDRYHPTFLELSELIATQLGKSKPLNIPKWFANIMAKIGNALGSKAPINSDKLSKITSDLTFDDSKAVIAFGWNPMPVLQGFKIK